MSQRLDFAYVLSVIFFFGEIHSNHFSFFKRLNNPEQNGSGILSANMYNSNGIGPNGSSMNASINNNSITNTNNPNGRNSTTNSQSINNNDDDNADGVSNADDPQTDEDVDPEMS